MKDTSQVSIVYDNKAHKYEKVMKSFRYHFMLNQVIKSSLSNLNLKSPKILDIGCGTGLSTLEIKRYFPSAETYGLDCSEEMLKIYQDRFPHIQTILGDFNTPNKFTHLLNKKPFSFQSDSFDLIISAGAISEYGNPKTAIPFIHTLLKEKGILKK